MNRERLKFTDYLLLLLILTVFAAFSFIFQLNQRFSFDQTQMLVKGFHSLFTGEYLPFGNEASTFGNLPGALSSFVIGFPLSVYPHAFSPVVFQILLRIIAVLFFANALSQLFSRKLVLLGTMLFALSTWNLMQGMLYNPAYLPLGACVFFSALVHLRNDKECRTGFAGRFVWSALAVLAVAWCMQFHMSWPVLCFVAFFMWIRRDVRISYAGVLTGAALLALSLWPFVQEVMLNPTLLKSTDSYSSDRYIGYGFVHVYPVLKGILYWLRFGSLLFTNKAVIPEVDYDDASMFILAPVYAWIGISTLVGVGSVIFAAWCNYFTIVVYRLSNHAGRQRFIRGFTISCILAVIIAAGLNTLTLNFWQIAIIMPFALVPVLTCLAQQPKTIRKYAWLAAIFLLFSNIVASTCSSDYDIRVNYRSEVYRSCIVAFTPSQCAPFTAGLTSQQVEADQLNTPFSADVVRRVIDGIKPLPENADEEYRKQHEEALRSVRHYRFIMPVEQGAGPFFGGSTTPVASAAASAGMTSDPARSPFDDASGSDKDARGADADAARADVESESDAPRDGASPSRGGTDVSDSGGITGEIILH